jgi:hypothetical protein
MFLRRLFEVMLLHILYIEKMADETSLGRKFSKIMIRVYSFKEKVRVT